MLRDPGKDARCQPGAYVAWRRLLFEVVRYDETYARVVCENCRTLHQVHVPVSALREVTLVRAAPTVPDRLPA